ncbi:MAG: efflux RND transporter periplasmic adaptor subunit [Acetobacteraceae bacterium]
MDLPEPTGRKDSAQEVSTERHEPAPQASRRLSRGQQLAVLGLAALLLVGLLAGQQVWQAIRPEAAREPAPAQSAADNVFRPTPQQWAGFRIQPAEEKPFRPAQDTDGKIAIDDDLVTPVFSPYSGRVVKLFASAGDTVRQGDPLFAVQASEFVQAQNDLVAAVATLRTARAQAALAETNEKRQHNLYLSQGAALKDWQQAQVDLATAQGNLSSAQIAVSAVRNRLRILGRSDAEIAALESAPDLMKLDPVAQVPAPIGGTVIQRQVGLGQTIVSAAAGATAPLFQIGDLSKVWLVANVREEDAPLIHRGDSVEVHVLAFPDRGFTARVTHVAPTIDPTTHRLSVRAELDNPDGALKPEMFASFRIITGPATTSLAIPIGALVYEGSDVHVWVANPQDETIQEREIRMGAVQDGTAQVLSGLRPGEQVVTSGSLFLDRAVTGD